MYSYTGRPAGVRFVGLGSERLLPEPQYGAKWAHPLLLGGSQSRRHAKENLSQPVV